MRLVSLLGSWLLVNAIVDGTVRLVGGPIGALLLALAGFDVLIVNDCASYLISAGSLMMTSRTRARRRRGVDLTRRPATRLRHIRSDALVSAGNG